MPLFLSHHDFNLVDVLLLTLSVHPATSTALEYTWCTYFFFLVLGSVYRFVVNWENALIYFCIILKDIMAKKICFFSCVTHSSDKPLFPFLPITQMLVSCELDQFFLSKRQQHWYAVQWPQCRDNIGVTTVFSEKTSINVWTRLDDLLVTNWNEEN
jgi:hypothetical protein